MKCFSKNYLHFTESLGSILVGGVEFWNERLDI